MARIKLATGQELKTEEPTLVATGQAWLVARICSEYIQYCTRRIASGHMTKYHLESTVQYLNELCQYCGALPARS